MAETTTLAEVKKSAQAWRNWSNEVQYRRADFVDPDIKGDFFMGTLPKGTYIVHANLDGVTLKTALTEESYLTADTDIIVSVTGGTEAKPQRLVIGYVPVTVYNMGFNAQ